LYVHDIVQKLPSLEAALHTVDSSDQAVISAIIGEYSELPMLKEQSAYHRLVSTYHFLYLLVEFSEWLCLAVHAQMFSSRNLKILFIAKEDKLIIDKTKQHEIKKGN